MIAAKNNCPNSDSSSIFCKYYTTNSAQTHLTVSVSSLSVTRSFNCMEHKSTDAPGLFRFNWFATFLSLINWANVVTCRNVK